MRLSTFTDYSLRLLLYLAAAPGRRVTIGEVAEAYAISEHHLVKVAHQLGRHGLLENTRGRNGGVCLARPAGKINIGRVVRFTEHGDGPADCLEGACESCRIVRGCRLPRILGDAMEAFYAVLEKYSLADIAAQPARLAHLLGCPPARPV